MSVKKEAILFFVLHNAAYILAIIFHCVGYLAIYLYPKRTNQNVILFFLSTIEIVIAITGIILNIDLFAKYFLGYGNLYNTIFCIEKIFI